MNKIKKIGVTLFRTILAASFVAFASTSIANEGSVFVSQVNPSLDGFVSPGSAIENSTSLETPGELSPAEFRLARRVPSASNSGLGGGNASLVFQAGQGNNVFVDVAGRNNFTSQIQVGSRLDSSIDLKGNNNSASVLQGGRGISSNIFVAGSNKTITHIQLGSEPGTVGNIVMSGRTPQQYIYIQRADGTEALYAR